ncbi:Zinc binding domain / DNA primase [Klebsiella oxytoca]|nr:Zinc binding domain / DNA primase [Klebsiella oxytoca]
MFGKGLSSMLKEYGLNYARRRTNQGMQTNLALKEESNADWLPRCDENHRDITYPERHQPVFFYLKFRKVNSKVFTVHGLFTVYHIEIKDK